MKLLLWLFTLTGASLFAQRAETHYFRAIMLPSNEVPAIDINASGAALLVAHVVRNAQGEIESGSVDFEIQYRFPGAVTLTGLHIHRGAAGVNGPVTISSGLTGQVADSTGNAGVSFTGSVRATDANGIATLRDMLRNPSDFYVNLHSTENLGGVIRGQLMIPEVTTLIGIMSPRNEIPPIDSSAAGLGVITAMRTFDADGNTNSGLVIFHVEYSLPAATNLTGLHIHTAPAGINGAVTINTGLTTTPTQGRGTLAYFVEVPMDRQAAVDALNGLYSDPAGYYVNLHTTESPGGLIRGQLRRADENQISLNLLPGNEVPPLTIGASAPSNIIIQTIRGEDGQIAAGRVVFDVNYRFPGEAEFTGLHIHNGEAGINGTVTINSGLSGDSPVTTTTGFGNILRPVIVSGGNALATLNSLVANPEKHYVNLHTRVNPGGVVRAQTGRPVGTPAISGALNAPLAANVSAVAPGGWMSIFGENLAALSTNVLAWEGESLPASLNGTSVTVGGRAAPLLHVSPGAVSVLVPFETPSGQQPVVVRNASGASNAVNVNVQAVAPAIWLLNYNSDLGQVVRAADGTFVTAGNPARSGDMLQVWATGLGQTTPALATGRVVPNQRFNTAAVTATIGGRAATVDSSVAAPGLPGVYIVTVRVPDGLPAGSAPLVLRSGETSSNSVTVPVR